MQSIKKLYNIINKSPFERSLIKVCWQDELSLPKDKHVRRIIDSLNIKNNQVTFFDNYQILIQYLHKINFKNWASSLKLLMIFHIAINEIGKDLSLPINQQNFRAISGHQTNHTEKLIDYVNATLASNYFQYLISYCEVYHLTIDNYKTIGLQIIDREFFDNKLPQLKKIQVSLVKLVKCTKELTISLQKFDNIIFNKNIGHILILDAIRMNEIIFFYAKNKMQLIFNATEPDIQSLYQFYTETLKLTKSMRQLDEIRQLIYPLKVMKEFKFFVVTKEKNKEIELHVHNHQFKVKQQAQINNYFSQKDIDNPKFALVNGYLKLNSHFRPQSPKLKRQTNTNETQNQINNSHQIINQTNNDIQVHKVNLKDTRGTQSQQGDRQNGIASFKMKNNINLPTLDSPKNTYHYQQENDYYFKNNDDYYIQNENNISSFASIRSPVSPSGNFIRKGSIIKQEHKQNSKIILNRNSSIFQQQEAQIQIQGNAPIASIYSNQINDGVRENILQQYALKLQKDSEDPRLKVKTINTNNLDQDLKSFLSRSLSRNNQKNQIDQLQLKSALQIEQNQVTMLNSLKQPNKANSYKFFDKQDTPLSFLYSSKNKGLINIKSESRFNQQSQNVLKFIQPHQFQKETNSEGLNTMKQIQFSEKLNEINQVIIDKNGNFGSVNGIRLKHNFKKKNSIQLQDQRYNNIEKTNSRQWNRSFITAEINNNDKSIEHEFVI